MFSENNIKYCPKCNVEVKEADKFCFNCGNELPNFSDVSDSYKHDNVNFSDTKNFNLLKDNYVDTNRKDFSFLKEADSADYENINDTSDNADIEENCKDNNKIDINKASLEELTKLPSINLIKAKKIINLRNSNNRISSFEDLGEKLNLNPNQLNQIKDNAVISNDSSGVNRIIDL